jgi:beta-N-acetylhexosaminidase
MRALAGTLGMERGFVAAVAAGADAIETGVLNYPHLVNTIPGAIQHALDAGALSLDRLRDAAQRTAHLAVVHPPQRPRVAMGGHVGMIAARCLEVIGQLPALDRPLLAEARPPDGMVAGELPWSLAEPLAQRMPDVTAIRVSEHTAADTILEQARGRGLVVVVRDVIRHDWQTALLVAASRHPSAVVVDIGWPTGVPPSVPTIRTRGIAPDLLTAAADLLTSR